MSKNDPVNPEHYKGAVDCIIALESALGHEGVKSFCTGNALKYLWRWQKKNGLEDLRKAKWYVDRLISYTEQEIAMMKEAINDVAVATTTKPARPTAS